MAAQRSRGFTLVEVLAAVAILAIAMAAILSAMTRYTGNAAHLQNRTLALLVAHNRLTELRLVGDFPATGKSDGDEDLAGEEWRWFIEVQDTEDPALRRVDIRVQQRGSKDDLAFLSAFMANPAP